MTDALRKFRPYVSASGVLLAIAASTAPSPSVGQQRIVLDVRGEVIDRTTGFPVAGASVEVVGRNAVTFTNSQGRFILSKVVLGGMLLRVRQIGYGEAIVAYNVAQGAGAPRIELEPNPVVLRAIEIVADRFESRRKAAPFSVRSYTTEHLAQVAAFDVYDVLKDRLRFYPCPTAGQTFAITVQGETCIRTRGSWVAPRIFVDDAPWMAGVESLRGWSKGDIHRIEVVHGGSQIWLFTRAFADRLAKGEAQLQPYIIVR